MYDLLLRGGRIIDPASALDSICDLAVSEGSIAAISPDIPPDQALRVIDVTDRIVAPGIIDLHAHVLHGVNRNALDPDICGVYSGVTTIVDAGSAGSATFAAFPEHILRKAKTDVIPFLHIGQTGLATNPEVLSWDSIDAAETRQVISEYQELIAGIKVRMVSPAIETIGLDMLKLARDIARESGKKLMVHIGDTFNRGDRNLIRAVLPVLEPGDIVTHMFTGNPGGVLDENGLLFPEVWDAASRGIIFDAAHGKRNFSFDVARKVFDQGMYPDCISTDLTTTGRLAIVFSMTDIMTRFLGLGFSVPDVIAMCTSNSARAVGAGDRLGQLAIGRQADISVLEIREGDWSVTDSTGATLRTSMAFVPFVTIKHGLVYTPDWGPRPWGWEPTTYAPDSD
jgi:dihydroorotase